MAMSGNEGLTAREGEWLELVVKRWTNQEIAAELVIDVRTVETHVASILHKLVYNDRQELWRDVVG